MVARWIISILAARVRLLPGVTNQQEIKKRWKKFKSKTT